MSGSEGINFSASIPRVNIKAFTNIFNFLLKVDAEVIIEASAQGMWLRALNDAKSAFVVVELDVGEFFSSYSVTTDINRTDTHQGHGHDLNADSISSSTSSSGVFSCKIFGRPVVNSLRNTRKISSLVLRSSQRSNEIILEFINEPSHSGPGAYGFSGSGTFGSGTTQRGSGSYGSAASSCGPSYFNVRRIHRFSVLQSVDILNATFNYPAEDIRYISASATLLNSSLKHLYNSSEISCCFQPQCMRFKSYHPEVAGVAGGHGGGTLTLAALDSSAEMSTEVVVYYDDVNEYSVYSQSQLSQQNSHGHDGNNNNREFIEMVFCVKEVSE